MKESTTQLSVTDKELQRAAKIQTVVNGLAGGKGIIDACSVAGITRETWRQWRKHGYIQDVVDAKFRDITSGVKDVVAEALVTSTQVLAALATGQIPADTEITGKLAPRDVVAAQQQLIRLWDALGGGAESQEREQERLLEELKKAQISILQVHVETMNIGSSAQPMPIPIGARPLDTDIVEGEAKEIEG